MLKDVQIDLIAQQGVNVAQFVSFGPDKKQRYHRIRGVSQDIQFGNLKEAISAIYAAGVSTVNIRTFLPDRPDGNPFIYGPDNGLSNNPEKVSQLANRLVREGYFIIINETIDIMDGGISGVAIANRFEFSSRDNPRCVEKPGCATLPRPMALKLIESVYGVELRWPYSANFRVEWTVTTAPCGYLAMRYMIWQVEKIRGRLSTAPILPKWPNRFSEDIGDKAFGLLIAYLLGFPVPQTRVFSRVVPYFQFGVATNDSQSLWVRTCPLRQEPGLFTTKRGWLDPFSLMQREDPEGKKISSILVQDGIDAKYSGAALTDNNFRLIVEGKAGFGDDFMIGKARPSGKIPKKVVEDVELYWKQLKRNLGPVRLEWVHDGYRLWIVQLHVGKSESYNTVIYPGSPDNFVEFNVNKGLEELRALVKYIQKKGNGIVLIGDVGVTSHFGDLLRRNKIPSIIRRPGHSKREARSLKFVSYSKKPAND
jgi:hypothetical protein